MMSTGIITFRSNSFDTSPLEDGLDPEQHPHGRDLATHLYDKLNLLPINIEMSSHVAQEHDHWYFDFAANGRQYRLAAHIVEEVEPESLWAVQMHEKVGFIKGMFRKENTFYEVDESLLKMVLSILQETDGVSNVNNITFVEFQKIY